MTLTEQVNDALNVWLDAHAVATDAAATYLELKRLVGSNEAERKERKGATHPEDYAVYLRDLPEAEINSKAAAAMADRAEKILNVLREQLQHESAQLQLQAAQTLLEAYTQPQRTPEPRTTIHLAAIPGIDDEPQPRRRRAPAIDVGMSAFEEV